ncbi:MAG TPA: bifunctional DNA-formamidopyrimidine glycosylase/DNA-(apurinic or apyrimidinic site) lyase [Methylocystis sp.]|nr:bifunctional DNA-formamidopyrimidine glycosylase/DNA-(apurinic or apyrimidinic site) lyase [Methylocystis sp.]
MPELPEVETVRRGLAPVLEGATIAGVTLNRADLRFPFPPRFAARLKGRRIEALHRRAKYLVAELSSGESLVMHLGMSGSFRIDAGGPIGEPYQPRGRDPAHDHVVFHLGGGTRVTYNDPRRFGFMLLFAKGERERDPLFAKLGPEPLGSQLSAEALAQRLEGRRTSLKAALLDQSLIAGLGNIYVCEALHRASLSPLRAAGGFSGAELKRLARAIKEVLLEAIEAGGSSLRDHRQTNGSLGYFQHGFRVYDREGAKCPRRGCPGRVSRVVQAGRSTFYCSSCQK